RGRANGPPAQLSRRRKAWKKRDRRQPAKTGLTVRAGNILDGAAADVAEKRVVHDSPCARPVFDRAHPPILGKPGRQREVPIYTRPARRHLESLWHLEDEIGFAELPAVREGRKLRHLRDIAARHAGPYPCRDCRDLFVGEPALADELAVPVHRFPW